MCLFNSVCSNKINYEYNLTYDACTNFPLSSIAALSTKSMLSDTLNPFYCIMCSICKNACLI